MGEPSNGKRKKRNAEGETEESRAAAALLLMSNQVLDRKSAVELENMKKEFLVKLEIEEPKPKFLFLPENPHLGETVDGTVLPKYPQVPSLYDVFGRISHPFEKQLTESDVADGQNRLTLNREWVDIALKPLLRAGEYLDLEGIPVSLYDIQGKEYHMVFKIWAGKTFVVNGEWKRFKTEQGFVKLQDWVTIWMFHHNQTGKLCSVITSRRLPTYTLLKRRNGRPRCRRQDRAKNPV